MHRFSLEAFSDELCKIASGDMPAAMQATLDKKLAPFKPAAPPPVLGPSATPPPAPTPPQSLDQRMSQQFGKLRAKASAAPKPPDHARIKTPRTTFGVRG